MREIKFRGKRLDDGEWVYGSYINYKSIYGKQCHTIVTNANLEKDITKNQIAPKTLGQFTGLKDKNGKDIYEGDKIIGKRHYGKKVVDVIGFVFYDKETTCYKVDCNYFNGRRLSAWKNIEVIGNIYDNQELLDEN